MIHPALRQLFWREAAGGLKHRLSRLKNPRYAVPLALGLSYLWFAFGMPGLIPRAERPTPELQPMFRTFLGPGLALMLTLQWLSAPRRPAPAFTVAEAAQLFVLPFSRRELLRFRLMRAQPGFLLMALIAGLLALRFQDLNPLRSSIGLWMLLNLIHLNQLTAAVALNRLVQAGTGLRLYLPGLLLALFVLAPVALNLQPFEAEKHSFLEWSSLLLTQGAAGVTLTPFHVLASGVSATSLSGFAAGVAALAGLSVLLYIACMLLVGPFEEGALAQAESAGRKLEAARGGNLTGLRLARMKSTRSSNLHLGLTGPAWRAVFWKTLVGELRAGYWRSFMLLAIGALVVATFMSLSGARSHTTIIFPMLAGLFAPMFVMLAPRMLATGMHLEVRRLELLKLLPVTGHQLLRGKTWAGATLVALPTFVLVLAGAIPPATSFAYEMDTSWIKAGAIASGPVLMSGAALMISLESGLVLMMPAWTVGGQGEVGIDHIGRNMVSMLFRLLLGTLAVVPAAAVGAIVTLALAAIGAGGWALLPGAVVGATVLAVEVEIILLLIGVRFDRMELSDEVA